VTSSITCYVACQAVSLSGVPANCDISWHVTQEKKPPAGTLGRRLWDARKKLGLSQAALARRLGCDRRMVIGWEWNEHRPGADWAEALAEELRLPLERVLDPTLAHVRRAQDARVLKLLRENRQLRSELADCRRENTVLRRRAVGGVS